MEERTSSVENMEALTGAEGWGLVEEGRRYNKYFRDEGKREEKDELVFFFF